MTVTAPTTDAHWEQFTAIEGQGRDSDSRVAPQPTWP